MVKQISTQNLKKQSAQNPTDSDQSRLDPMSQKLAKNKKTYIKLRSFRNGPIVPANIRGNHPPRITKNTINKKTS